MSQELINMPVYVQKINGHWYGYMPIGDSGFVIEAKKDEFLGDFVSRSQKNLAKIKIHPIFKCIQNYGLEEKLTHIQQILKEFSNDK